MTEATQPARAKVVVGVDGSDSSLNALRWAAKEARLTGATLHAVTAWEYPLSYGWAAVPDPEAWHERQSISSDTGRTTSVVARTVVPCRATSRIIG